MMTGAGVFGIVIAIIVICIVAVILATESSATKKMDESTITTTPDKVTPPPITVQPSPPSYVNGNIDADEPEDDDDDYDYVPPPSPEPESDDEDDGSVPVPIAPPAPAPVPPRYTEPTREEEIAYNTRTPIGPPNLGRGRGANIPGTMYLMLPDTLSDADADRFMYPTSFQDCKDLQAFFNAGHDPANADQAFMDCLQKNGQCNAAKTVSLRLCMAKPGESQDSCDRHHGEFASNCQMIHNSAKR